MLNWMSANMVKHLKELGTWLVDGTDDCSTSECERLEQRETLEA